jgi:predicted porin
MPTQISINAKLMKSAQFLASVASIGLSSTTFAQSGVTLYGIIDPDVVFVSNAQIGKVGGVLLSARQYSMQDGATSAYFGSRFGLKGAEDLGGGTSAIFTLENGFNAANGALGQGGLLFGRQAFVGLSNRSLGAITAGRQYSSVVDYLGPFTSVNRWGGAFRLRSRYGQILWAACLRLVFGLRYNASTPMRSFDRNKDRREDLDAVASPRSASCQAAHRRAMSERDR